MRNLILESASHFLNGQLPLSQTQILAHFQERLGQRCITPAEDPYSLAASPPSSFDEWAWAVVAGNWNRNLPAGWAMEALWQELPTPGILRNILLHDPVAWNYDLAGESYWSYKATGLDAVMLALSEEATVGNIWTPKENPTQIMLGAFSLDLGSGSKQMIYSSLHYEMLLAAIFTRTAHQEKQDPHHSTLPGCISAVKSLLIGCFIHRSAEEMESFLKMAKQFRPYLHSLQRLKTMNPNELIDFIFLYTGGRVLTEDPRGWLERFALSLEKGEVLFEM